MDTLLLWFQSNLWQTAFVSLLILFVFLPFVLVRRRIKAILSQVVQWRELEQNIQEIGAEEVRYFPNPTRHVLASVLSQQKGSARAGAVGPALEYLAAETESPIRSLRSLSYLAVLIGLLGTVTMLALALERVDVIGQLTADLLKNIYPINAFAIGLAVAIFLSYSWYRHKADQFVLMAARVLGRLRNEQLGGADPVLLAALEKVGERFKEWGEEIHAGYLEKANLLVKEMRELQEAVVQVVTEAMVSRQEDDKALAPLLRSQDAKIELLTQMLYQGYSRLFPRDEFKDEGEVLEPEFSRKLRAGSKAKEEKTQPKTGFFSRYFR
jgi:biopolymer transport protein ExbB/TolQ